MDTTKVDERLRRAYLYCFKNYVYCFRIQKAMFIVAKAVFMAILRTRGDFQNYRNCNSLM